MAFWGTRMLEIVKKHDSGGLVWKRIKLTSTRKANAKKRLRRVWQLLRGEEQDHPPISNAYDILFELSMRTLKVLDTEQHTLDEYNEAVLRACSEPPPSKESLSDGGEIGSSESNTVKYS